MGYPVELNNTSKPLIFLLVDSADHLTGKTGLSPTVTISKNGGAFAAPQGAVSEIGNGLYALAANAIDANTLGPIILHATASGADDRDETFDVVQYNPATVVPASPPSAATSGTTTATRIIKRALRLIGALGSGETMEANQAADGLEALNGLMDEWAAHRLTIFELQRVTHTLTPNTGTYTLGPGGDIDRARPVTIEAASVIDTGQTDPVEYEIEIFRTWQKWQRVLIKSLTSDLPLRLYTDKAFPLMNLTLWPIPTSAAIDLCLYLPTAMTGFTNLSTQYAFPPGYRDCITFNLAKVISPEYGRQVPPLVARRASHLLHVIKRSNQDMSILATDHGLRQASSTRGSFDINIGDYRP